MIALMLDHLLATVTDDGRLGPPVKGAQLFVESMLGYGRVVVWTHRDVLEVERYLEKHNFSGRAAVVPVGMGRAYAQAIVGPQCVSCRPLSDDEPPKLAFEFAAFEVGKRTGHIPEDA